jgi:sporulation related protein
MADYDRGPYAPSERLAFDPRKPVRGGGPAPVTLIMSALVLVIVIAGVAFLYRNGFRPRGEAPSVVGAPVAQMKVPAPDATNSAAPQQLTIQKVNPANTIPAFAPPPEEPLPRPASGSTAPASQVAAASAKPVQLTIAGLAASAGAKPVAAAKPAAVVGPAAAAADKGWSDTAKLNAADMRGKGKKFEAVSAGGKTLYRAYVTGFASRDAAQAFCGKLKAAGKACLVK